VPDFTKIPYQLVNTPLASTDNGREVLKYLIDCALPKGVQVSSTVNGKVYYFQGSAGLASQWLNRTMTLSEQRWVSACLLSRVNFFGEKVKISMRANINQVDKIPDFLQTSAQELASYPFFEGGFYGNLFLPEPVAYTCLGENSQTHINITRSKKRVCTHPLGDFLESGETLSQCGFIVSGVCRNLPNKERYDEVIYVYLQS